MMASSSVVSPFACAGVGVGVSATDRSDALEFVFACSFAFVFALALVSACALLLLCDFAPLPVLASFAFAVRASCFSGFFACGVWGAISCAGPAVLAAAFADFCEFTVAAPWLTDPPPYGILRARTLRRRCFALRPRSLSAHKRCRCNACRQCRPHQRSFNHARGRHFMTVNVPR